LLIRSHSHQNNRRHMTITNSILFSKINSLNSTQNEEDSYGEVCIANISPKERLMRKHFAIGAFMFTLVVLVVLVALDVNPLWRLLLFGLFSAATTSYIQALDKT